MSDQADTTAVVTGAAQGIGRAIARRLANDGAHVVVLDIADGTETVEQIEAAGGSATFQETDVTDEAQLADAFADRSIDALVNNAAYYAPIAGPEGKKRFDDIDREEWEQVMEINATGVFLTCKHALPSLSEGASIVNIASGTALKGTPGFLHYVTSKAAVIGMSRAMASELGDLDVRVNAVTPGFTASPATLEGAGDAIDSYVESQDLQRRIQPEDIADAVGFLAGPDSGMITGQVLNVDGGQFRY